MTTNGQASTASVLWALHEAGADREVWGRLRAEAEEIAPGRALEGADVAGLVYTRQVISETMRLYGPAWLLTRTVNEPARLAGYALPRGATVIFSPYIIHRDPAVFPDPARFDPERWSPGRARVLARTAFQPFGGGTRQCIGENFAWSEMVVILAEIVRHWDMIGEPGAKPRPVPRVTIHPDRLVMTPSPARTILRARR